MTTRRETLLLGLVLVWALGLRAWRLDGSLFTVDEAESTINALTILAEGVPVGRYLGQPIFENTLTEPWPESPEYEFRDVSYSSRGFAIYHGWLPLYSIAAALRAAGIEPDRPDAAPGVTRSAEDVKRVTRAARAPAILFGMALLVLLFRMGDELYGRDAAWGALLCGAFSLGVVDLARQARYYSLLVLLSTACCLAAWRVYRHGRWRDYLAAALALALLFHTHAVGFLIACAALAGVLPLALRRPGSLPRSLACGALLLALTLPWILYTGFLEVAGKAPRAWPYLAFPEDLLAFLGLRWPIALLLIGASLAFLAADLGERWLPEGFTRPFLARRAELRFLIGWLVLAYLVFTGLTPAASYSLDRMTLAMLGPGIVLAASLVAALARSALPNPPTALAGVLLAAYLALFGNLDPLRLEAGRPPYKQEALEFLRRYPLQPDTRLYATPNFHLLLSVYTGLPVQSVAPVRKSFLDAHPGEILLIEVIPFRPPTAKMVRDAAWRDGIRLGNDEAQELAWLVTSRAVRERLSGKVAELNPPLESDRLPDYLRPLVEGQPSYTQERFQEENPVRAFPAMFRGFEVADWATWWPVFFYRFVGPEQRMGAGANYRERLADASATVLPSGATVYRSPARAAPRRGGTP
jgi:hypothetical protein